MERLEISVAKPVIDHLACSVISMPSTSGLGLAGFLNFGYLLSLPGGDTKACRSSLWVALVRSGSSDVIG
ncbi:hypothetical protein [Ferrimicrobium acidiphilum]|uniref:hypothetical protein n=1 Tax=Ferrimicrobium acidiphilum TaxID=121039 RepID=UPI0023F15784|nr:hypothetical protein [Ferrimicrobium acidiphilum]